MSLAKRVNKMAPPENERLIKQLNRRVSQHCWKIKRHITTAGCVHRAADYVLTEFISPLNVYFNDLNNTPLFRLDTLLDPLPLTSGRSIHGACVSNSHPVWCERQALYRLRDTGVVKRTAIMLLVDRESRRISRSLQNICSYWEYRWLPSSTAESRSDAKMTKSQR